MDKPKVGQPNYGVDPKDLEPKAPVKDLNALPNKPDPRKWLSPENYGGRFRRPIQPNTGVDTPALDTEQDKPKPPKKRVIKVADL